MTKTSYNFDNGVEVGKLLDLLKDSLKDLKFMREHVETLANGSGSMKLINAAKEFIPATEGQIKNLEQLIENCEQYCEVYKKADELINGD